MPGGDRTGPLGGGPMTGRGAGYCAGYQMPGYTNPMPGRGWFGRGRGAGRGWRHWYYATGMPGWARFGYAMPGYGPYAQPYAYAPEMTPNEETDMLRGQAEMLQKELKEIQERIDTLEKVQAQEKK